MQDACNVGDEGGFAPNIGSNEEGLNLVNQAIEVPKSLSSFYMCFSDRAVMLQTHPWLQRSRMGSCLDPSEAGKPSATAMQMR